MTRPPAITEIEAELNGLLARANAQNRDLTPVERERRDELLRGLGRARDAAWAHDEPPMDSRHASALANSGPQARAICFHEAGHAVAIAAEGQAVMGVWLQYRDTSAGPIVSAGHCVSEDPISAVAAWAGHAAEKRAGLADSPPEQRFRNDDRSQAAAAVRREGWRGSTVYVPAAEAEFRRRADQLVYVHWGRIAAIAERLLMNGRVEGAELQNLLQPVRSAARRG